ncbi:jupiter microtubule associated homolog 1-like [Crotalus tigris]|uniref:jupiter microtubule associated homolog 1-like n=1 Tax=Crotalus tigris TaxID=88082 RepID=UPI00192F72FC|nr:jupiter microtubule associated homolog 1-like [Crotalus tigris]
MTTTTTYTGMDPSGRSSSRVLRPPGGGSNFNLGFDLPKDQQGGKRNRMASCIFGTPEENPPSWAKSTAKSTEVNNSEAVGSERRGSSDATSGDCVTPKSVESEAPENTEETASGLSEEKPLPAAPVPSPVAPAPAPSRRNPPGGKSSLVLG